MGRTRGLCVTELSLSLACWDYDRTRPVLDGRVGVNGWRIEATAAPPGELFPLAVGPAPYDVTEMSLSSYLMQRAAGTCAYIALPVFVSRAFRHGAVYVRTDAGIETPTDLEGRLVGVPEYQMTLAVWVRGILADEYGVDVSRLRYRTAGLEKPGRKERLPLDLPAGMDVAAAPEGSWLDDMLVRGEIDAVMAPSPPPSFVAGDARVRRLIADPKRAETDYYRRTGIFPVMHAIGVRESLADAHPGLAAALFRAFAAAKRLAMAENARIAAASANKLTLPWFADEWEATRALMGDDFWPYGLAPNRAALEALCRYSHEQFLSPTRLDPEALFHPETLDLPA